MAGIRDIEEASFSGNLSGKNLSDSSDNLVSVATGNDLGLPTAGKIIWASRGQMISDGDGYFNFRNNAGTAEGILEAARLQLWSNTGSPTVPIDISTDTSGRAFIGVGSSSCVAFNSATGYTTANTDAGVQRSGTKTLRISQGTVPLVATTGASLDIPGPVANAQTMLITSADTQLTGMSGATATATNLIPAGAIILGFSARVTTLITGCTTIDIGISGGDTDCFGTGIALTAGTTTNNSNWTAVPAFSASAQSVLVTAVGGGASFTAGAIRLTVHYATCTAPTS